jgi:oligopeptidase B
MARLKRKSISITAKLRNYKTDNNLLLLKTEMKAGHGGKTGRDSAIEEIAFDYAFALKISKNTPCL